MKKKVYDGFVDVCSVFSTSRLRTVPNICQENRTFLASDARRYGRAFCHTLQQFLRSKLAENPLHWIQTNRLSLSCLEHTAYKFIRPLSKLQRKRQVRTTSGRRYEITEQDRKCLKKLQKLEPFN